MKINWLTATGATAKNELKELLQLEYKFRLEMTKKLIDLPENLSIDFNDIHFNFHVATQSFEISEDTPEPLYSQIKKLLY